MTNATRSTPATPVTRATRPIVLTAWKAGLISDAELLGLLGEDGIHGGIEDGKLTAYDYVNQCWIEA